MKILLCSLPQATSLCQILCDHLKSHGIDPMEIPGQTPAELAAALSAQLGVEAQKAVFLGETGIDVYARAAAYPKLAPVICHDPLQADQLRLTPRFRTLCMGCRIIKPKYAASILDVWLINDMMEEDRHRP